MAHQFWDLQTDKKQYHETKKQHQTIQTRISRIIFIKSNILSSHWSVKKNKCANYNAMQESGIIPVCKYISKYHVQILCHYC